MKKFLFLCILAPLFLISCKGNGSGPSLSSVELNQLLSEYATYLSNNYERGDTLVF